MTTHADGKLEMRGVYYKEKATRVVQPMLDASFSIGEASTVSVHGLVDSITSASAMVTGETREFKETRGEGGARFEREQDWGRWQLGGRVSHESDYKSVFGQSRVEFDFNQKNTKLAVGTALGRDTVSNGGDDDALGRPFVGGTLWNVLGSFSLSQILSETTIGTLTYDAIWLSGFQESPYRLVLAGGNIAAERLPDTRLRHAVLASVRHFFPTLDTACVLSNRVYRDSWSIWGLTPEIRIIRPVGPLTASLRYRFHWQSEADFYDENYLTSDMSEEPYLTSDVKLSGMTTQTFGIKLELALGFLPQSFLSKGSLLGEFETILQDEYYGTAVVAHFGVAVPFEY